MKWFKPLSPPYQQEGKRKKEMWTTPIVPSDVEVLEMHSDIFQRSFVGTVGMVC